MTMQTTPIRLKETDCREISAEELFRMPESEGKQELVYGKLVKVTPVGFAHGKIVVLLCSQLSEFVRSNDLGEVVTEVGFVLSRIPDSVLGPDIAFINKKRLPKQNVQHRFFEGYPDCAIEILSPWDSMSEVLKKIQLYLSAGAQAVWIVDPNSKTVEIYYSANKIQRFIIDQHLTCKDIFPGLELDLKHVFN